MMLKGFFVFSVVFINEIHADRLIDFQPF